MVDGISVSEQSKKPKRSNPTTSQSGVSEPTVVVEEMPPIDERQSRKIGTNRLDESSATLELTYTSGDPDKINYSWSVDDPWVFGVDWPRDFVGISFETGDYEWAGEDINYGPYTTDTDAIEATGPGYRMGKYNAATHSDNTISRFGSWMDKGIKPENNDRSERKIYADYIARWNEVDIAGVSAGTGGVSVSFEDSTGLWQAETNAKESKMADADGYVDDDPV
ncbi:hypothetical protein [Halorhabdus sp. SVX81]|uniref:hypothetical protein n=1 Tax=Halorhabdus sp. SVX81 TaxID=2978283 RepID=UPI0023DC0EBB|nr:hypothetical protein [Halorhabdus sp. SVX81]